MLYPASLSSTIESRAFKASNGELGFRFEDLDAVLETCRAESVAVLGWEVWLVDHACDAGPPVASQGSWTGVIPGIDGDLGVFADTVSPAASLEAWRDFVNRSLEETRARFEAAMQRDVIAQEWRPLLRVNLTFASS